MNTTGVKCNNPDSDTIEKDLTLNLPDSLFSLKAYRPGLSADIVFELVERHGVSKRTDPIFPFGRVLEKDRE